MPAVVIDASVASAWLAQEHSLTVYDAAYLNLAMTVQLNWPSDVVNRLLEEARQEGLSLDAYLLQAVLDPKRHNAAPAEDEADGRRKRAAAGARILDIQRRVKPDPEGWTSRDYVQFGRR